MSIFVKGLFFSISYGIIVGLSKRTYLKVSVRRIMAITSAFQADDAGSIPAARSKSLLVKTPRNALKFNTLY